MLPARGVLYGADVAPAAHVVGERQQALAALAAGGVVVAEAVALLERFLPLELQPRPLELAPGDEVSFDAVVARLATLGLRARRAGALARRVRRARRPRRRRTRPSATRCASSSGATRSRACAPSRCTRSAPRGTLERTTVYASFEADTSLPEYETGLHQAIAAWEREGREEAPDELFRRAGVRALAALAGRFTTVADVLAAAGLATAVFNPDETYRALAEFDAEVGMAVDGAGVRERLYVPLAEARALLAGALQVDLVQRDQPLQFARLAAAVRGARPRRRRARPAAPGARRLPRLRRLPSRRARRSAPPTGCAT